MFLEKVRIRDSHYVKSLFLTAAKRIWYVLFMSLLWTNSAVTEQLAAEAKLEIVKQRLVDLALQSEVRLGSSAYLDGDGVLHETSIMSSSADIRGVRVLAYLDEAGIDTASIDANIFANLECPGSRPDIRRQALVRMVMDTSYSGGDYRVGDHYVSELLNHSEQTLLELLAASPDWQSAADVKYQSEYDRYMSAQPSDQSNYRFDISIRVAKPYKKDLFMAGMNASYDFLVWGNPHLPGIELNQPWPGQKLEYELSLVKRVTGAPIWKKTMPLDYPRVGRGYKKDAIPDSVKYQIAAINQELIKDVTQAIDCQTEHYALNIFAGHANKFKIYAGSLAGIHLGDQFLISTNANILTQALSLSGLAELGLAEVESMTDRTAILRHMAGPKPQGLGNISSSVAIHF